MSYSVPTTTFQGVHPNARRGRCGRRGLFRRMFLPRRENRRERQSARCQQVRQRAARASSPRLAAWRAWERLRFTKRCAALHESIHNMIEECVIGHGCLPARSGACRKIAYHVVLATEGSSGYLQVAGSWVAVGVSSPPEGGRYAGLASGDGGDEEYAVAVFQAGRIRR